MASPWQLFTPAQPIGNLQGPVYSPDLSVRLICPYCRQDPPNIVELYHSGDLVCSSCGLVLDNRVMDDGSNLRNSSGQDFSGQGCEDLDYAWDCNPLAEVELPLHVARDDVHTERSSEKKLTTTCEHVVPPTAAVTIARDLYERVEQAGLLPPRHRKHLARRAMRAACLLVGYRLAHTPRTFVEISKQSNVDMDDLKRAYKVLRDVFNVKSGGARAPDDATDASGTDPEGLLVRFCNNLDIAYDMVPVCRHVLKKALELEEVGNTRRMMTVVGSAIYFTGHLLGRPANLDEVASVACLKGAAMVTLYAMLYRSRGTIVPQEWIEDGRARLEWLPRPSQVEKFAQPHS